MALVSISHKRESPLSSYTPKISGGFPSPGHFSFQILITGFVYQLTIVFLDKVSEMLDLFKDY